MTSVVEEEREMQIKGAIREYLRMPHFWWPTVGVVVAGASSMLPRDMNARPSDKEIFSIFRSMGEEILANARNSGTRQKGYAIRSTATIWQRLAAQCGWQKYSLGVN